MLSGFHIHERQHLQTVWALKTVVGVCRHAQVCVVSWTGWRESDMWRLACRDDSLVLTPCWSLAGWECTVTLYLADIWTNKEV
jgi:hypothetical protein